MSRGAKCDSVPIRLTTCHAVLPQALIPWATRCRVTETASSSCFPRCSCRRRRVAGKSRCRSPRPLRACLSRCDSHPSPFPVQEVRHARRSYSGPLPSSLCRLRLVVSIVELDLWPHCAFGDGVTGAVGVWSCDCVVRLLCVRVTGAVYSRRHSERHCGTARPDRVAAVR